MLPFLIDHPNPASEDLLSASGRPLDAALLLPT
jgi:hypothetical protein